MNNFKKWDNPEVRKAYRKNYKKIWKAKNPLKFKEEKARYSLKKKYGISWKEYESKLKSQKGVCAICGGKDERKRLSVDHCHQTGKIRGLLCSKCNIFLGRIDDDIKRLCKMVKYLRTY